MADAVRAQPAVQVESADLMRFPLPLHHANLPFVLAYTNKAGCTSLTKWFLFQIGELERARDAAQRKVERRRSVPAGALRNPGGAHTFRREKLQARPGYGVEWLDIALDRTKPVIKLVRNPYDRAVSSFLHLVDLTPNHVREWPRALWDQILRAADLDPAATELSFRAYLTGLKKVIAGEIMVNRHVAPQYVEGEERIVSRVIRLENFEAEIRRLESEFGLLTAPLDRIVESRHHRHKHPSPPGSFADVPVSPRMIARGDTPTYSAFYDEGTRELVTEIYRADLARYGYEEGSGAAKREAPP